MIGHEKSEIIKTVLLGNLSTHKSYQLTIWEKNIAYKATQLRNGGHDVQPDIIVPWNLEDLNFQLYSLAWFVSYCNIGKVIGV